MTGLTSAINRSSSSILCACFACCSAKAWIWFLALGIGRLRSAQISPYFISRKPDNALIIHKPSSSPQYNLNLLTPTSSPYSSQLPQRSHRPFPLLYLLTIIRPFTNETKRPFLRICPISYQIRRNEVIEVGCCIWSCWSIVAL
jgi:hypothetical protein